MPNFLLRLPPVLAFRGRRCGSPSILKRNCLWHSSTGTASSLLPALFLFLMTLSSPRTAQAQKLAPLEFNGGWVHNTGNFGTDGLSVGAAWWFSPKVSMAANYDTAWDTSPIAGFLLGTSGSVVVKSHLRSFLIGPRIAIDPRWLRRERLSPFVEVQFGVTHLNSTINRVSAGIATSDSSSDNAFSWMLGAGTDYMFDPHWSGRISIDFLRTHLDEQGQSRLRLVMGVAYTFGPR